jgi:hypothetical protein
MPKAIFVAIGDDINDSWNSSDFNPLKWTSANSK